MTIESAIQALRRVGQLTVEGGTICCDLPDPTPAEADRALDVLREHKPEALALLGSTLSAPASGQQPEQNPAELSPSDALKGYAVCLCSDLGGENLWIVADEQDAERLIEQGERRGAIYTRAESRLVTRIDDPEIVKQVHAFKREFNTRMLPPDHGK